MDVVSASIAIRFPELGLLKFVLYENSLALLVVITRRTGGNGLVSVIEEAGGKDQRGGE